MFFLTYAFAELRRRRGRTIVTALGLGVGVALVAVVTALSAGLDRAQDEVLEPLLGLGTDLTVERPVRVTDDGSRFSPTTGGANLTADERDQLLEENEAAMLDLDELGDPGERFVRDVFISGTQLSFPAARVGEIAAQSDVEDAAGALTLTSVRLEGDVPEAVPGPGGDRLSPAAVFRGNIDFEPSTVSGVDVARPGLGAVTPGQIVEGRYFSATPAQAADEAVLTLSYAAGQDLDIGSRLSLGGDEYRVVGLSEPPLGGQATDAFVELGRLQVASGREDRVNLVRARARDADGVMPAAESIAASFPGAQVTTADDLVAGVSGSLVDADNLARSLGTALAVVAMVAAVAVACLLTLSSVAKRTRELGTLKAVGWPGARVVRQVAGESVIQGLLGGIAGAVLGLAAAGAITAIGPPLTASAPPSGPPPLAFGQGEVADPTSSVELSAPLDVGLVALAIALAVLGGLIAGAVGGYRASRLRPADALRHVE
ncbi:MAG: ABC transporter permease [Miltoncostaeaceae bacterium]